MKVTGEKGIGNILKNVLQIGFWAGIIILIALPIALHFLGLNFGASAFVIYPNGIVLLVIMHKFIELFDSLKKSKPFCKENVKILKTAGIVSGVGSAIWLIDLLYEIILAKNLDIVVIVMLAFLTILFLGVSIALYILSELFKEANMYKTENELTI